MTWTPDPEANPITGAIVSDRYSIYEVTPGRWRALWKENGNHGLYVVDPGTSLVEAKKACAFHAVNRGRG